MKQMSTKECIIWAAKNSKNWRVKELSSDYWVIPTVHNYLDPSRYIRTLANNVDDNNEIIDPFKVMGFYKEKKDLEIGVEKIDIKCPQTRRWIEVKLNGEWVLPRDIFDCRGREIYLTPEQTKRYESVRLVECRYTPMDDGTNVDEYIYEPSM